MARSICPFATSVPLVLLAACHTTARPPGARPPAAAPQRSGEATALELATRLHLGDGIHTDNYYFIADHLRKNPGSAEQTQRVERAQREALQSAGETILKPPSANIVESEFSHLLGAVMESNRGVGAAVFDAFGLKIGAAGLQLESIVLTERRLKAVLNRSSDEPLIASYSCAQLKKLARACNPLATRGVPCQDLERTSKRCQHAVVALYRPVIDHDVEPPRPLGVSMLVVRLSRTADTIVGRPSQSR